VLSEATFRHIQGITTFTRSERPFSPVGEGPLTEGEQLTFWIPFGSQGTSRI